MNKKSGITMTSMVLYVALFFAFSAFAIAVSTNYNHKTLMEKGNMWINEQFDKLQMNLLSSGRKSTDVSDIGGKIVFSNDDEYRFENGKIYLNDGVCISDVTNFELVNSVQGYNVPKKDSNMSAVMAKVTLEKYGITKDFELYITAGDEFNE